MLVLANLIIPRDYVFRLMIFERKKFSRRKKGENAKSVKRSKFSHIYSESCSSFFTTVTHKTIDLVFFAQPTMKSYVCIYLLRTGKEKPRAFPSAEGKLSISLMAFECLPGLICLQYTSCETFRTTKTVTLMNLNCILINKRSK